jgi:hypothetical protein
MLMNPSAPMVNALNNKNMAGALRKGPAALS